MVAPGLGMSMWAGRISGARRKPEIMSIRHRRCNEKISTSTFQHIDTLRSMRNAFLNCGLSWRLRHRRHHKSTLLIRDVLEWVNQAASWTALLFTTQTRALFLTSSNAFFVCRQIRFVPVVDGSRHRCHVYFNPRFLIKNSVSGASAFEVDSRVSRRQDLKVIFSELRNYASSIRSLIVVDQTWGSRCTNVT